MTLEEKIDLITTSSIIKSIQRGMVSVSSQEEKKIIISPVDVRKSIVIINAKTPYYQVDPGCTFSLSENLLTINIDRGIITWQIIEFY